MLYLQRKLDSKHLKDKSKVREGEKRGTMHSISSLNYSVPKKIPIAFHNRL